MDDKERKNRERRDAEELIVVIAIVGVLALLVIKNKFFGAKVRKGSTTLLQGPVGHYVLPVIHVVSWLAVLLILTYLVSIATRLRYRRIRRAKLQTVEVVLSRDDTTEPLEISKFFDAVNGTLLPRFGWTAWFTGVPYFVWEQGVQGRQKYIRLSAQEGYLTRITARLQAAYQNIRFTEYKRPLNEPMPPDILQLKLERNWFYPLQTLRNYQASMAESFFASLEDIEGNATFQVVMVPLSLRKQSNLRKAQAKFESKFTRKGASNPEDPGLGMVAEKELKASIESRGKGLFRCELRLYADSKDARQAVIGAMAEAGAENRIVPESWGYYLALLSLKKAWWKWTMYGVPAFGLGPYVTLSSFHLATIFQLPSMRLRSSGFKRASVRRIPLPHGITMAPDDAFLQSEEGQLIGIQDSERYGNVFIAGMQGSGKSSILRGLAAPVLMDPLQASIIITPDREDAQRYLEYIPPDKPVFVIDLARPGEWGLNILSDDTVPTDTLSGNLLSTFRTAYGHDSVLWQSAEFLQQPLYALRKVREIDPKWKKMIPILDFRHIQTLLVVEEFREALIDALPEDSQEHFYWKQQFAMLQQARGEYARTVRPILNKLTQLLASPRLRTLLCHPNPLTVRKVIDERGVLILCTAKSEIGEETAVLMANMLTSLVYQAISSQAELPKEQRVPVNQFYDELHGYANDGVLDMLQESRKYGARTAGATLSRSSLPESLQDRMMQLFAHKIVFRINEPKEARTWAENFAIRYTNLFSVQDEAQDRIIVGPDDFMSLPRYHAICQITVNQEAVPAFLASTRPEDPRSHAEWTRTHHWPDANEGVQVAAFSGGLPAQEKAVIIPQAEPESDDTGYPYGLTEEDILTAVAEVGVTIESPVVEEVLSVMEAAAERNQKINSPLRFFKSVLRKQMEQKETSDAARDRDPLHRQYPCGLAESQVVAIVTELGLTVESPLLQKVLLQMEDAVNKGREIRSPVKYLKAILTSEMAKSKDGIKPNISGEPNLDANIQDERYAAFYALFPKDESSTVVHVNGGRQKPKDERYEEFYKLYPDEER